MTTESTDRPVPGKGTGGRANRSKAALDKVFGDVLPAGTRDDLDDPDSAGGGPGARSGRAAEARRDDELRRNVPPHHQ